MKKNRASRAAQRLIRDANICLPPVPVEKLAKSKGASIRFSPLDEELSGMIYVKEGIPIIGINALHHPNRQRFTISHELGHLVLHTAAITREVHVDKQFPMLMRNSASSGGIDPMEIEANAFAAELLMPEQLLLKELDQVFDIDDDQLLAGIAQKFRVSLSTLRYRIGNMLLSG